MGLTTHVIVSLMDILLTEQKRRKETEVLAFRIDSRVVEDLTKIAKKRGLKAGQAARIIVTDYVQKHSEARKGKT